MTLTEDQTLALESFIQSEEFDLLRRYAEEYREDLDEQSDHVLTESFSSVLQREQMLGGKRYLSSFVADFCNFVKTQKQEIKESKDNGRYR